METNVIEYSSNRFKRVWTSPNTNGPIIELDQTLIEGNGQKYLQTAWMGRGCYKSFGNQFVFLKGIGPTSGSEKFRQIMDKFWKGRSPVQKGGCVRLTTNDFPILIEYFFRNRKEIEVFDPRPEGYSIYGAVLREAIISEYLYNKNFYIPQPVAIYRTDLLASWENGNKEQMAQYCYNAFLDVMKVPGDVQVNLSKIQYEDCKAGLFVRIFNSEIRLQEIVEVYIHHESQLPELSKKLDEEAEKKGWENWPKMFACGMIRNLIMFLKFGVIHSNLQTHYQNFSLSGEICDWDAAIIHKDFPCALEFKNILQEADLKYCAEMMRFYEEDEKLHEDYNTFAIQQIYAIINSCMFAKKIRAVAEGKKFTQSDIIKAEQELINNLVSESDSDCIEQLVALAKSAQMCQYRKEGLCGKPVL